MRKDFFKSIIIIILIISISFSFCYLNFLEENTSLKVKDERHFPKFTCTNQIRKDGICFAGKGEFFSGNRLTQINPCSINHECKVKDYFMSTEDVKCTEKKNEEESLTPLNSRLPGEHCSKDQECRQVPIVIKSVNNNDIISDENQCIYNRCKGANEGEKCNGHLSCVVGLQCFGFNSKEAKNGICKKYLKGEDLCTSDYECGFRFLCEKITNEKDFRFGSSFCIRKRSLDNGMFLSDVSNEILCKSEKAFYDENLTLRCGEVEFDPSFYKENVDKEVIECSFGDKCKYIAKFTNKEFITLPEKNCESSINSSGKGYCPFIKKNMNKRFYKIQLAEKEVEAKEKVNHNINREQEFSKHQKQFSEFCRSFYSHAVSYNSRDCTKLMNEISECDFFN